jgi:hypothetical protein
MMNEEKGKYKDLPARSIISFNDFPAEILLKILDPLETDDLIKCSQTSKRLRKISFDDSLWKKVNLSKKRVHTNFLQKVISKGCICLNLNEAKVIGTLRLENESQLKQLDLSGCTADNEFLFEELLKSCHFH